jgi:hypothetical protein
LTERAEKRGEAKEFILKPAVAEFYTKHMGACDQYDADATRYGTSPLRKTKVWRRAYFSALFKYFILNTWSLVKRMEGHTIKTETQRTFLRQLRDMFISDQANSIRRAADAKAAAHKAKRSLQNKACYANRKKARKMYQQPTFKMTSLTPESFLPVSNPRRTVRVTSEDHYLPDGSQRTETTTIRSYTVVEGDIQTETQETTTVVSIKKKKLE